jgi:hypothetical protein
VAKREEVTTGKASIFTCIDGSTVEEFEIEIIKTIYYKRKKYGNQGN